MKTVPRMKTDEEAEAFLEQDLADLDYSTFKPLPFEFRKKESTMTIRIPTVLMEAVKAKAKEKDMPYARYVRMVLESALQA